MRRIVTGYFLFLSLSLMLGLIVHWGSLIAFGSGSFFSLYRSVRIGPLYFVMQNILVISAILIPGMVLCMCRFLQRISPDGRRFSGWVSLPAMSNLFALLATVLSAYLLVFDVDWAAMASTNWPEVFSNLGGEPPAPEPPSDDTLEYPTLPLAPVDPYGWKITDIAGNEVPMSLFQGKVVFLNFWTTWCGFCKWEFPNIQRLYDAMKENPGIAFVLLSPEEPDVVKKWLAEQKYTMPFYTVERDGIPGELEPSGLPTTFILAPDGRIAFRHSGFAAWDGEKTKTFLKALAGGNAPPEPEGAP